jgi:transcriptional regulator of acetoin/glycerol metabolism
MMLTPRDGLARARNALIRHGTVTSNTMPAAIRESWTRCLAAGLDPNGMPSPLVVDPHRLAEEREQHDAVRRLASAEIANLYQQIAGTNFMIAFAAPDGLLLDTITDRSFRETAGKSQILPGALWTEQHCGTNALGTCATTGRATIVHGAEHFFACLGELTCTAAPIYDPQGNLAGLLDASSNCRSRQEHTGALVSMAATQIENTLLRDTFRRHMIVQLHNRAEYLHTLSAGLLAIDDSGVLLVANAQSRFLLQGLPAVPGRQFHELFRTHFTDFRDAAQHGEIVRLEDRVGSVFAARVESLPLPRIVQVAPRLAPPPMRTEAGFVAEDPVVAAIVAQVEAAVARSLPVLICGETGTGKEVLARHAHSTSGRRGAFVPVNCAALPEGLVQSELFGHADGAFTGARRGGSAGLVADADGGTLFLDEIGEMARELQTVLLRLLDDWTIRPVGGGKRRRVDIQLVAATNVDIEAAMAAGRFRADLYWRLNTLEVTLPPLRERSDIAAIARQLLRAIAPEAQLTDDALASLAAREWHGNIRELRSILARATLRRPSGTIDAADLGATATTAVIDPESTGLRASMRERIARAYRDSGGNVTKTARRLGVSRNTVYRVLGSARRTPRGTGGMP